VQTTVDTCVRSVYCKMIGETTTKIILDIFFVTLVITVELHVSVLIGTASHPDMQKIRIIGFSLKIGSIGSLKLAFTIYSMYLCLNLSTFPHLKI
jgi:hypothetical protein